MEATTECTSCFVRQGTEAVSLAVGDPAAREPLLREVRRLAAAPDVSRPPAVLGQAVHRAVRRMSGDDDPYREVKHRFNRLVLGLLPELEELVNRSPDPLKAAVTLAVAANIIDFGAGGALDPAVVLDRLRGCCEVPLVGEFREFAEVVPRARRILYLTDNAGEIAVDRLLVEALGPTRVTVGVRGHAVINDATLADAQEVGLRDVARVIGNGNDAPGTMLDQCSPEFLREFGRADLIVAKGQANFETLSDVPADIFFLFMVKCPVVAAHTGLPPGTHVIRRARPRSQEATGRP